MAKTNDALNILNALQHEEPEVQAMIKEATLNARVAQVIRHARTDAGLTQQQLAKQIGKKKSVIARLKDADWPFVINGPTLIAKAESIDI